MGAQLMRIRPVPKSKEIMLISLAMAADHAARLGLTAYDIEHWAYMALEDALEARREAMEKCPLLLGGHQDDIDEDG